MILSTCKKRNRFCPSLEHSETDLADCKKSTPQSRRASRRYSVLLTPELAAELIGRDARFLMERGGEAALPLIPNQGRNLADFLFPVSQQFFCPVDPAGQDKLINRGAVKHTEQIGQFRLAHIAHLGQTLEIHLGGVILKQEMLEACSAS